MKKIFIAYANEMMAYSLKRIGREASRLNFFDEIKLWTPSMLPREFRNLELMQHSYGGGYWAWKPFIIHQTLEDASEGDIVCYADSGCTLRKHPDWDMWSDMMKTTDTILFQYPDEMDIWEKFGAKETKIKHWTKRESILFYDRMTGDTKWRERNKIWGGSLWIKDKNNPIITEWLDIVMNHPEIILDPKPDDEQFDFFAQHKHDQSLMTALSVKHSDRCILLPAKAETDGSNAAIEASRIRVRNMREYVFHLTKEWARNKLGLKNYNRIKQMIK